MTRSSLLALKLLALLSLSVPGCAHSALQATQPHDLLLQRLATERYMTLSGDTMYLPLTGKVTVIDFWATWCKPCLPLLPQLETIAQEYGPRGVSVVGVVADDNPGVVQSRVKALGLGFPLVIDDQATIRGSYHVKELPRTFVVDRNGKLRFVAREGAAAARDIRAALDAVLAEQQQ
jgi:thiol-disulfide isomerase/thioredoxin